LNNNTRFIGASCSPEGQVSLRPVPKTKKPEDQFQSGSRIAQELATLRQRIDDLELLESELTQAEEALKSLGQESPGSRSVESIRAEIEQTLGYIPAFLVPAFETPAVLQTLWAQTRFIFADEGIPGVLREKLFAHLARYCTSPYAIVAAACRLRRYSVPAAGILALLTQPTPDSPGESAEADLTVEAIAEGKGWPEPESATENALLACCSALYQAPSRRLPGVAGIRNELGPSAFEHLACLVSNIRSVHLWLEAHPEISYDADPLVRETLLGLLREEPRFGELFRNYFEEFGQDRKRLQAEKALLASEERYRELFENAIDMVYTHDLEGNLTSLNKAAERITGYNRAEALKMKITQFVAPEYVDLARRMIDRQATGESKSVYELEIIAKDGHRVALDISTRLMFREGKPTAVQGIARDVTERKRTEAALQHANQKLEAWVSELEQRTREMTLLNEMGDMLRACLTMEEAYMVIVRVAQQVFPVQVGALYVITPSRNLVESVALWGTTELAERVFAPDECWALRRGRTHWIENTRVGLLCKHLHEPLPQGYLCVPMMAQSEALGVLHLAQAANAPMTEAKQRLAITMAEHIAMALSNLKLHETLRSQSIRDPLTGLFNRRFMEESLELELRRAGRNQRPLGVIMLDLDQFKHFNDTYGHEAGDTLLRELGSLLQGNIRGEDIACRYGGEEFTLILPEGNADVVQQRANALREAIKHLDVQHRNLPIGRVTASMGVALFPEHGRTGQALLQAADAALYRSKDLGRDRVTLAK
jgi:diguanylate cyclase (GGDEF)-like protein/PAS domain S-box-containing protein